MTDREERAAALDAAARETPGVADVYTASPDVVGRIRSVLAPAPAAARSHVDDEPDGRAIVTAGVRAERPVAEIAADVAARARALEPRADLTVRISRIEVPPASARS